MNAFDITTLEQDSDEVLLAKLQQVAGNRYSELIECVIQRRHLMAVTVEVAKLTASSTKLEALTIRLKNLTVVLIVLTVIAAAVPIGIEYWKYSRESQTAPVSAPKEP
ncbi:MAG: hypothetical protein ABI995_02170 [Acidobacteriota bacterium]